MAGGLAESLADGKQLGRAWGQRFESQPEFETIKRYHYRSKITFNSFPKVDIQLLYLSETYIAVVATQSHYIVLSNAQYAGSYN